MSRHGHQGGSGDEPAQGEGRHGGSLGNAANRGITYVMDAVYDGAAMATSTPTFDPPGLILDQRQHPSFQSVEHPKHPGRITRANSRSTH